MEVTNDLEYVPIHHRAFFQSKYAFPQGCAMTFFHPLYASRLDRVWAGKTLQPQSCRLLVNPWSDHTMVHVNLTLEPISSRGRQSRWTLRDSDLKFFRLEREIILTVELHKRAIQCVLASRWKMSQGIPYDHGRLQESRRTIKDYQERQRQRRHLKRVARASGPVLQSGEWEKDRISSTSQNLLDLRISPEEEAKRDSVDILEVISKYYGQLYGPEADLQKDGEEAETYLKRTIIQPETLRGMRSRTY
ncbi:UNVERIFIED_CONTAM: hypothetical protein K2H54_065888 [Gekko kuhli]